MNISKTYLGIGAVVCLILGLGLGYKLFSHQSVAQGISSVGASGTTEKLYSITIAPATTVSSSTSITNTDGTDRAVTSATAFCTGVGNSFTYLTGAGLANLTLNISTSSSAVDAKANANYASAFTISTSSAWAMGSSTWSTNDMSRVWPAGSVLNFTFSATNTAACTVGVRTLPL